MGLSPATDCVAVRCKTKNMNSSWDFILSVRISGCWRALFRWRSQGEGWTFQQEGSKDVSKRVISDIHLDLQGKTWRKIWGPVQSAGQKLLGHKYGIHCPPQVTFRVSSSDAPWVGGWMGG